MTKIDPSPYVSRARALTINAPVMIRARAAIALDRTQDCESRGYRTCEARESLTDWLATGAVGRMAPRKAVEWLEYVIEADCLS